MRIGTLTFHWAKNYGAILQTYGLQQYLKINGFDNEIINYLPANVIIKMTLSDIRNLNFSNFIKEIRFKDFRKKYLKLSKKKFTSSNKIKKGYFNYDIMICGSDQIWNEWFILNSEKEPNLSYYLDFVKKNKKRISYATSFGTNTLTTEVIELVKPELNNFNYISVRENTGKEIVEKMGLNAKIVIDPTLLLNREDYEKLIIDKKFNKDFQFFSYILHEKQIVANSINEYIYKKYFDITKDKRYNKEPIGIIEWLYNIKNCKLVLTNSYHGTIFAIIFNKPFLVIPVEGSNMNNRISTLLSMLGLESRIIEDFNETKIDRLIEESIDWEIINTKVINLRRESEEFLKNALKT